MAGADYPKFPSIPRLSRDVIITEKIDGTNAQVHVGEDGTVRAGSRNRWLTPEADNFGFAAWAAKHEDELRGLGPGSHYGEWWGQGIQRGYGIDHKRFSLFNTSRWSDDAVRPACCGVVPVLGQYTFCTEYVDTIIDALAENGSVAAPGFMQPEGIVVFHPKSGALFKKTLDGDGHKGR